MRPPDQVRGMVKGARPHAGQATLPTADREPLTVGSRHSPMDFAFASSHHQVPGAPTPSLGCRSGRAKASQ